MFVAARIFSINKGHVDIASGLTSFETSSGFQSFINTGLLGAVVTTIFGCLIWRIIASGYPLLFMSNPIIYLVIHVCLLLDATGLCSASWALGGVHRKVASYKPDEHYLPAAGDDVDAEGLALTRSGGRGSEDANTKRDNGGGGGGSHTQSSSIITINRLRFAANNAIYHVHVQFTSTFTLKFGAR